MSYRDDFIRQAQTGNRQAFDWLVERYHAVVLRFVQRHARSHDEAADLTQNTFIKAYLGLAHLREATKFDAWLHQIALNECWTARRARGLEPLSLEELNASGSSFDLQGTLPSTEEVVFRNDAVRTICQAIDELSNRDRAIANAFFVEQQPYATIERAHGLSRSALASRIHRIRKSISRRMGSGLVWLLALTGGQRAEAANTGGFTMKATSWIVRLGALTAVGAIAWSGLTVSAQDSRALCMSNLKQLGLAFHLYAQDYDLKLPPADRWCDVLKPYRGLKEDLCHCPAEGADRHGYAMNIKLSRYRIAGCAAVAQTVVLYESSVLRSNATGLGDTIAFRHEEGAHYLFGDGHVQWLGKGERARFDVPAPAKATKKNKRKRGK